MNIVTTLYTSAKHGKTGGVSALTFAIPVYAITNLVVGDVSPPVQWFVKPGFGTNAFDLDNGRRQAGGAILLAVGDVTLDFLTVNTTN